MGESVESAVRGFPVFVVTSVLGVFLLVCQAIAATGDYTKSQAVAGKALYDAHCASCHMTKLTGGAGPALAGKAFASYLKFSHITGAQLLSFVMTQMPYNAPGSLKPAEYRRILAYILQFNHYPAGSRPLTDKSATGISMLPYPGKP